MRNKLWITDEAVDISAVADEATISQIVDVLRERSGETTSSELRIVEVRDALDYMDWIAQVAADWPSIEEKVGVLAEAAWAYIDLLDKGAP